MATNSDYKHMSVGAEPDTHPEHGLRSGVIWNLCSLGFLAFAGLMLNFAIARLYSPEALGLFNIVFAIFIFASQLGTLGIHFSILRAISEHHSRKSETSRSAAFSGVMAIAAISTVTTLALWAATPLIAQLYEQSVPGLRAALLAILPGLWAFSINKGLFNIVNGARHMHTYAILQSLRYVVVLACFAVFAVTSVPPEVLPAVFTVSELVLLPVLGLYSWRLVGGPTQADLREWVRTHLGFGTKVFLTGAIVELNSRVDVLMLGFFIGAKEAGIYSVAALVAEGVGMAILAIRNNFNPLITQYIVDGNYARLTALSRKTVLFLTPAMVVLSIVAWLVFPYFVDIALGDPIYHAARPALVALMMAIALGSGFMVFNMMFSQAGRPGLYTLYCSAILGSNILMNALLIPRFGILGAAAATSVAYIMSIFLLWGLGRRVLGVRLVI